MFTQETSARSGSRLAAAVLVALALTVAVLAVAIEANSIRSGRIGPQVQRVPAQPVRIADPALPTSIRIPKGCRRRKFGCGQGATAAANSDLRTSSHTSKGCWRRKFGCGQGATTTSKRP